MTAADLQRNFILHTRAIAEASKDPTTAAYLQDCLLMAFSGNYGEIPAEDAAANNEELEAGEGRILARYEKRGKLAEDIYIICYFSASNPGNIDLNNNMILYCSEY